MQIQEFSGICNPIWLKGDGLESRLRFHTDEWQFPDHSLRCMKNLYVGGYINITGEIKNYSFESWGSGYVFGANSNAPYVIGFDAAGTAGASANIMAIGKKENGLTLSSNWNSAPFRVKGSGDVYANKWNSISDARFKNSFMEFSNEYNIFFDNFLVIC